MLRYIHAYIFAGSSLPEDVRNVSRAYDIGCQSMSCVCVYICIYIYIDIYIHTSLQARLCLKISECVSCV